VSSEGVPLEPQTVTTIAAMPAEPVRNGLVTQTYHQLALGMGEVLGTKGANWFHFATWASFTVGRIVTGATMPEPLRLLLVGHARELGRGGRRLPLLGPLEATAAKVANELSEGNITVFGEMAAAGVAFVAAHTSRTAAQRGAAREELDRITAAAPPVLGKPRLAMGLEAYAAAVAETDRSRHAQLVLAGSIDFGAEEQFRLDPYVAAGMCAGISVAFQPLAQGLQSSPLGRVPSLKRFGREIAAISDRAWDELMTRSFMVVDVAGERLRLGHDVPPFPGQALIAPPFAHPSEPELVEVIAAFDRTHGTGRHDASVDWANLRDRMDWICWFFLSRQLDPRLSLPPFTRAVVRELADSLAAVG